MREMRMGGKGDSLTAQEGEQGARGMQEKKPGNLKRLPGRRHFQPVKAIANKSGIFLGGKGNTLLNALLAFFYAGGKDRRKGSQLVQTHLGKTLFVLIKL